MSGNYFDPGDGDFAVVDGQIVEKDALRIAEKIKEYDDSLEVICLDPTLSDVNDAPFIICERRPNGTLNRIFEAWKLDDTVVERIILADRQKFDPSARLESIQSIQKKLRENRYKDRQAEISSILEGAIRNRTSSYKIRNHEGELVKIHENKPSERVSSERSIHIYPGTTPIR